MTELRIDYPVRRAGSAFEAAISVEALGTFDATAVRFFVVQDDNGNRYPAIIEHVALPEGPATRATVRGTVVGGNRG